MARYELTYEELVTHTVIVEAENEEEAKVIAERQIEALGEDEYDEATESYDMDSGGNMFRFCDELDA